MTFPLALLRSAVFQIPLVVGVTLLFAACGGGESNQSGSTDASTAAADTTTIEVTMTDYAYKPARITVPAGEPVTLQFTNEGTVEHYFVVGDSIASTQESFRQNLFSGVSITKTKHTEGQGEEREEEHEEEEGGHENVFELPPDGSGSMTFTLPASKAGTYTIACFETTGGKKHYQMGMEGTLTVTASME